MDLRVKVNFGYQAQSGYLRDISLPRLATAMGWTLSLLADLEAAVDCDPFNADLLCELLDQLLIEGWTTRARNCLDQSAAPLRSLPGVIFREARCALMEGDFATAVSLLRPLISEMQPVPGGLCHDLAWAQFQLRKFDDALHALSLADEADSDAVAAVNLLRARILFHQRHIDAALALLDNGAAGDHSAEFHGFRALLLLDLGDMAAAKRAAAKALALSPSQFDAMLVSATIALSEQRNDIAVPMFQHLIAAQPTAGRAYLGLGEALMLRGEIVAAHAALDRAATYMPEHIGTWHALAWCQMLQGNLDGALQSFNTAFVLDRSFGETHGGRALVHALRGEVAVAGEAIRRALKLDPNSRSARYAQSVLLLDEGRVAEAQAIIQSLTASSSSVRESVTLDFVYTLRELLRPTRRGVRGH